MEGGEERCAVWPMLKILVGGLFKWVFFESLVWASGVRAQENRSDVDISSDLMNIIIENNIEIHLFTYCRS